MGLLDRHTRKVRVKHVAKTRRETLHGEIKAHVAPGATVNTDEWVGYKGMPPEYVHKVINHAESYVRGTVHTNGIENFWSLLPADVQGHLRLRRALPSVPVPRRRTFRFNERKDENGDAGRFAENLGTVTGRRLTYKELIGKERTHRRDGLRLSRQGRGKKTRAKYGAEA